MLDTVGKDRSIIKKDLGLAIPEFYIHCGDLIRLEKERGKLEGYAGIDVLPADFPSTYQRLLEKVKRYQSEGYDLLIDPLFGNKIGSKLGKIAPVNETSVAKAMAVEGGNDTKIVPISGENDLFMQNKKGAFTPERYADQ